MKKYGIAFIVSLFSILSSTVLFADCPMVGGYHVSAHNANDSKCTYVANNPNFAASHNPKLCMKSFILTDPHYKVVRCKYSHGCVCTISVK